MPVQIIQLQSCYIAKQMWKSNLKFKFNCNQIINKIDYIKINCWFSTCTVDSWDSFYMFSYDDEKTDLWQQYSLNASILTTQFKEVGDKKVFFIFCSVTTYFFRCYSTAVVNTFYEHFTVLRLNILVTVKIYIELN